MLLVDSGAQYQDGTTDITRTFVWDRYQKKKKSFTLTAGACPLRIRSFGGLQR